MNAPCCGWTMPRGAQLNHPDTVFRPERAGERPVLFLACGGCGVWIRLELSPRGGWAPPPLDDGTRPAVFVEGET